MVEYEFITGSTGISADYVYNKTGSFNNINSFSVSEESALSIFASLNGQHLLETEPVYTITSNITTASNSGDYYNNSGQINLAQNISGSGTDFFYYSKREQSESLFFESETNSVLQTGINNVVGGSAGDYDYYLNGVKLTSDSYTISATNFSWIDSDTTTTGRIHAVIKRSLTGIHNKYDYIGATSFATNQVIMHINGLNVDQGNFLQTYSGFSDKIITGFTAKLGVKPTGTLTFSS